MVKWGMNNNDMQKITLEVPANLLATVKRFSGGGTTKAVREALQFYASMKKQKDILKLCGSYKPSLDSDVLRRWED